MLASRIDESTLWGELFEVGRAFNHMCDRLERYIDRVYTSELREKQAELDALQARIDPHFLNNTLEVIRMKAITEHSPVTAEMVYNLSRFFRYRLNADRMVPLRQEIDTCVNYLKLVQHRFSDTIEIETDVPAALWECRVLHLCIQPLVENYIVHGLARAQERKRVILRATPLDQRRFSRGGDRQRARHPAPTVGVDPRRPARRARCGGFHRAGEHRGAVAAHLRGSRRCGFGIHRG